jgi:L-asparaginase II
MTDFHVRTYRGGILDSEHRVSAVVCHPDGTRVAVAGDPERVVITRSAAKPFQALPLVVDGAAERFAVSDEELALACASHNSERRQVRVHRRRPGLRTAPGADRRLLRSRGGHAPCRRGGDRSTLPAGQ